MHTHLYERTLANVTLPLVASSKTEPGKRNHILKINKVTTYAQRH